MKFWTKKVEAFHMKKKRNVKKRSKKIILILIVVISKGFIV